MSVGARYCVGMSFGRPRKLFTEDELYDYAVGALGRRMRSVAELKRLLRNRVEADTEIGKTLVELIVVRLKDRGYLNDAKYAAAYPGGFYRNKWWVMDPSIPFYAGHGINGQHVFVHPPAGLVVAKLSTWPAADDAALDRITDAAVRAIAAKVA